ncbi:MAG TPA: SMI1/KNR4 family protein, partial [Mycobacterium sp.]|nr:SMI1/KNR4 family protein [Mycobacterium sp.]
MSDTAGDVDGVLAGLEHDPPISQEALAGLIEHVARTYETRLPDDYVAFLRTANGADGHLANGIPIALWSAEVLPEANLLEGSPWLPGCLVIGSDTGDTVYAIDMREDAPPERYL